uniref:Signal peptidase complex subunit 3 n=1 Tax=Pipistrellus kuhlii TaxID=59472 RepID=A0A7J7ZN07_PIPKU|nr:signal peptidase complex subunit 3 [Pipistrellus kuhlii]
MNTVLSRANSLFAFSLSVMAALTFGCFITTAFKDRSVPVRLHVSRIMLKNVEDFTGPREKSDLGFINFDITADLENIFDWNVKQLFLYLSAEYSTKNNALNQVVLWDKIVLRGDNPKLLLKDMKTKYFFFDDGNGLNEEQNSDLGPVRLHSSRGAPLCRLESHGVGARTLSSDPPVWAPVLCRPHSALGVWLELREPGHCGAQAAGAVSWVTDLETVWGQQERHADSVLERRTQRRNPTSCHGLRTRVCSVSRYI